MKRILFFVITSLCVIGCKCDSETGENPTTAQTRRDGTSCTPTIVISKARLGNEYENWMVENHDLICDNDDTDDMILVDLNEINDDTDNALKADWLRRNGNKVDYFSSSEYVKGSHILTGSLPNPYNTVVMTESEIIKKINQNIYLHDEYVQYVEVRMNPSFDLVLINKFNPDESVTCLSIPFIRSLLGEYDSNDSDRKLRFCDVDITKKGKTKRGIVIQVKESFFSGWKAYNYTKWPALTEK